MVAEEEGSQVTRRTEWLRALGSGVEWGIDPLAVSVSIQMPSHALRFHTPGIPLGRAGGRRGGALSSPFPRSVLGGAGSGRGFPLSSPENTLVAPIRRRLRAILARYSVPACAHPACTSCTDGRACDPPCSPLSWKEALSQLWTWTARVGRAWRGSAGNADYGERR